MKNKFLLLLSVIIISVSSILFVGCDSKGQTPVYQGMSIGSVNNVSKVAIGSGKTKNFIEDIIDGDYDGRDEDIDEDDPFEDGDDEDIEEELKSSLNVVGAAEDIYYAKKNEDIFITIHIDNPDNYEIMSFTLNGKKYTSYMFEDGSDMENIILKYNVGDKSGVVSYTIDAIKYIDGTKIKDVIILGNKTVKAGIFDNNQIKANITNEIISTNSINFDVNIKDNDGLLKVNNSVLYACLYDGCNIIEKKELKLGDNSISWNNLKTNTMYEYGIAGYYDNLTGNGLVLNVLLKKAFYTNSVVLFKDVVIGQDNISWNYLWDNDVNNKVITSLKLYKGTEEKIINNLSTSIDKLLSNTEYKLVAEYVNLDKTEKIYIIFKTEAKIVPTVDIINLRSDKTNILFDINKVDIDNTGKISKIELLHGNDEPVLSKDNVYKFENLLSNNEYVVKVTFEYNLNDGKGLQFITKEKSIKTIEKTAPIIEFKNVVSTKNSISGEYLVSDVENINTIDKVILYKNDSIVKESQDKSIMFNSLDSYTDYTIKILYHYNLNDGNGDINKEISYNIKTQPHLDVKSVKVSNTSAVSEGETIFIQAVLDNCVGAKINSVIVNGMEYNVLNTSTNDRIFVDIEYNGQFEGGNTPLTIEKINATLDNKPYSVDVETTNSANVFINGKLEVISISYVNEQFEPVDWTFNTEKIYGLIKLHNPTGYIIDSININSANGLKRKDDNTYYFDVSINNGTNKIELSEISYHNEYLSKNITINTLSSYIYKVMDDKTYYIKTADDLKNIKSGYYYELSNDIDLADLEWHGIPFNGVFDGKGYSIKNMSFVGTVKNKDVDLGLFLNFSGVIKNVNMVGITFILDILSSENNISVGGLCNRFNNATTIVNCTIDRTSVINIDNKSKIRSAIGGICAYDYYDNTIISNCINNGNITGINVFSIGGICGHTSHSLIKNCINNGVLSGDTVGGICGSNEFISNFENCTNNGDLSGDTVGGICGSTNSGVVNNCINNGSLTAYSNSYFYIGGICGKSHNNIIMNCINSGSITGYIHGNSTYYIGGICGHSFESTITNCINNGNVSGDSRYGDSRYYDVYIAGIVGGCSNTKITNSYTTKKYNDRDVLCTLKQLNDKTFYIETLGWSEQDWDFSDLNVESGKLPKLKSVKN